MSSKKRCRGASAQFVKVLAAAAALDREVFTAEELVVAAWRRDPKVFGLAGFEQQHPNAHKVFAILMGQRGLVHQGYLTRLETRQLKITEAGRQKVAPDAALESLDDEALVLRLQSTRAFQGYAEGSQGTVQLQDARRFWDLLQAHSKEAVAEKLDLLEDRLTKMAESETLPEQLASQARSLWHVHRHLRGRFARFLA